MKENNAPSFKEIFTKTFRILKGYKHAYIIIIVFCLLAALFNSIAPYFLGYALLIEDIPDANMEKWLSHLLIQSVGF